ncbi:MAG TPA: RIP metalloprotease RseP [Anaerolineae bacterium]|nr:RIP metalloprotease RseP [Anaerolineae bacterium]HXW00053.1 RIP metalloprotease RseP [Anaerolineae bacterium]
MDPIYLIAFIVILSILVFVHELGHFVVAKRAGITVEEFAIGFPPRLVKLWQDEGRITLDGHEFVIGKKLAVPRTIQPGAQVYVETGVDEQGRPEVTKLELVGPAAGDKSEKGKTGSEAKFFSLLSRSAAPAPAGDRPVVTVEALTRPTEYTINWIPFGGYVRMVGEEDPSAPGSFASKSKKARFAVLVAGSLMNLVAAVVFFTLAAMSGTPEPVTGINLQGEEAPVAQTVINEVISNTPAAEAGLQAGDIIMGAEGVDFKHVGDLVSYIEKTKGTEVTLRVERNGEIIQASLTPRVNPPENQGAMGVGISYEGIENTLAYQPLPEALASGISQTARYVALTFYMPIAILQNIFPAEAARPTGPVGIYQQTGSAVDAAISLNWWFPVLWFTAVLSTALAVTNLLPLPALDGGRILFIIIEAIRGKRVAPEKEGAIHFIGLALLVTLMLVISYYDISNPIPPIDWTSFF